jgi:hypothetical protein
MPKELRVPVPSSIPVPVSHVAEPWFLKLCPRATRFDNCMISSSSSISSSDSGTRLFVPERPLDKCELVDAGESGRGGSNARWMAGSGERGRTRWVGMRSATG